MIHSRRPDRALLTLFVSVFILVFAVASTAVVAEAIASDAQPHVKRRAAPKVRHRRGGSAKKPGAHAGKKHAGSKHAVGKRPMAKKGAKTKGKRVTTFASGSPLGTIRQVFRCVLDFDESSGFDCYVLLNVESNRHNINARTHLRRYQWRHFRKFAASYVGKGRTFSLRVTRTVPAKRSPANNRVKYFFYSAHRDNPAPITLKREGNRWLIYNNSL